MSPPILIGSLPVLLLTSQSVTPTVETSPGKTRILLMTPAASTYRSLLTLCFVVMGLLTPFNRPLYTVPACGPYCPLAGRPVQPALNLIGGQCQYLPSCFIHLIGHPIPACSLLMTAVNFVTQIFHPLDSLGYLHSRAMTGTHKML